MPAIADYSEEDEDAGGAGGGALSAGGMPGGGASSGAPGGARQAQPSKQQEQAFVPWSRFVDANADVSKREAGKLNSAVRGQVDAAKKAGDTAMDAFNNQVASNYDRAKTPFQKGFADGKEQPQTNDASGGFMAGKSIGLQQNVLARGQNVAAPKGNPNKPPPERPLLSYVAENTLAGPKASAVENGPTGSKDLEAMMGAEAWDSLVGDTTKAAADANALGSEAGVEGLLQKQGNSPNSAFDAALTNGAAGSSFGETAKAGEGLSDALGNRLDGSQRAWQTLVGDIDSARDTQRREGEQDELFAAEDARVAAERKAKLDEAKAKLDEAVKWVKEKFPTPAIFETKAQFDDWLGKNITSGNAKAWAAAIYGPNGNEDWQNVYKLLEDIQKMTDQEYELFKVGIVPDWMGQGVAASAFRGGQFGGLGHTGNHVTATGTNDTSGLSKEDREKFETMKAIYDTWMAIYSQIPYAGAAGNTVLAGGQTLSDNTQGG
jgi:hypothetical protein